MKFFLGVCVILSLVSADTIFLEIKVKTVTSPISQTVLDSLAQTLPGLLQNNIPAAYKDVAADYAKYAQNIVIRATNPDASQVVSVKAYFPDVPVEWHAKIISFLNAYSSDATVTGTLTAALPVFLQCGSCQFDAVGAGSDSSSVTPPGTTPTRKNSIVGFKVLVNGANPVSKELVDAAMNLLPGLLKSQINILSIPQAAKDVLVRFAAQVQLSQTPVADPKGLWVQATFPEIPSSYVQLYFPLFMKYVYENPVVRQYITDNLPKLIGCQGCGIGGWAFINEPVTPPPTSRPTVSPTPEAATAPTVPAALAAIALPVALLAC